MAGVNELCDVITCEGEEAEGEGLSRQDREDIDDIPPSLLRYFETSKSRAAVCEKLILQEPEDLISHDTEDMMNLSIGLARDTMELKEQVICDTENEESDTSTDTQLLPAPTEAEAHFRYSVSVCPTKEDGEDNCMESERHFTFDGMTLEMSLNEEETTKSSEYEAEREKRHCEKMMKEEKKRQIERDFQHELTKIMEAEKLHQEELELMEKRAQEKLEQELLLQQELLSNLRRRVEEESRLRAEEQRRIKDEEEKRKREEEEIEKEAKRKQMEEEKRWREEEQKKIEEMKLKKEEEERRKKEEERKRMKKEEERKREEERKKRDLEKKKREDEMRMMKEEEDRKNREEEIMKIKKEEEERRMRQEERKMREEARRKMDKQRRRMEEEMRLKKEEECRKKEEEERINKEENMRMEEERRRAKETERVKKEEQMRKKTKGEEDEDQKRMNEEMRRSDEREQENEDEEIKPKESEKRTEKDKTHGEEEEEEEGKTEEKGGRKMEEKKEVKEKYEGENKHMKEERRPKSEQEIRLREDKEGYKEYDVDNRETEQQRKTEDKEEEEEKRKKEEEEERENVEAEKEQDKKEVEEKKKEINNRKKDDLRQLQEEREDSVIAQNETNGADETQISLASKQQDCTTWTSSGADPLLSESTASPCRTVATPQQHDPDSNISQTPLDKTVDCENQEAAPSAVSVFLPLCLPEHTEQKRLSWMRDCISWSKLSLQNRRKQRDAVRSRREPRRFAEGICLPPLCTDFVLQSGWKSLQQVTTVTLEDLPGCSLSTLSQCTQLRSLSLRRCGLKSLEDINQLPQLCYIDVQENDISFVNCENMTTLRVLRLGHNKLTSIHGLTGAENLDILDLSHNSITRIAGLESMRRLQRLSLDHNQLISTKGLRDVYTLLHLSCSHNHLTSVEGLENSALLNTLDLRANSLTETPSLSNHVLLRALHLDDNSISSLQGLTACWLPLMQHLSVAQNRITQLSSMSDLVSLANLDLRFNCMSELQNLCESLQECWFMREIYLTGNPLQQESGWRSSLQKALPGLRAIDDQDTDSFLSPPSVQQVSLASGSFLMFCQAQLQQAHDLQQQHSRELSIASSPLDSLRTSCCHFSEALQVAVDQRFAHEYGDTTVVDKDRAAGQTIHEETLDVDSTNAEKYAEPKEIESTGKVPPVIPERINVRCSLWTFEGMSAAQSPLNTVDTATGPQMEPTVCKANSSSVHLLAAEEKAVSSNPEMPPVDLDLQNTAAVVIQQRWKKHRQRCGNISSLSAAEKGGGRGGDEGQPVSGPFYINRSVVGQDYAATVIQAFWRGFTLRRRLASALAAVTCPGAGEDDTFEEVDVDEFVFDEAALEEDWTLLLSEDPPPKRYPVSEQSLCLKPSGSISEPSQDIVSPPPVWRSKQAWVAGEQVDSAGRKVSPVSSSRGKSPISTPELSGLSARSEKILEEWGFTQSHTALLMLKRAQKMKSKKPPQRKCRVREAELGLQQADKTERVKEERAQEWLHIQTAHPDRDSESVRFLPEISSDILNGGRVQLVAGPGYTERLHHASGLWANSSLAGQPCKENNYPRRNSLGHAREEVPSPKQVTSAPSKKERISFRDNPVQLSGGWGGGKKRGKVYK